MIFMSFLCDCIVILHNIYDPLVDVRREMPIMTYEVACAYLV